MRPAGSNDGFAAMDFEEEPKPAYGFKELRYFMHFDTACPSPREFGGIFGSNQSAEAKRIARLESSRKDLAALLSRHLDSANAQTALSVLKTYVDDISAVGRICRERNLVSTDGVDFVWTSSLNDGPRQGKWTSKSPFADLAMCAVQIALIQAFTARELIRATYASESALPVDGNSIVKASKLFREAAGVLEWTAEHIVPDIPIPIRGDAGRFSIPEYDPAAVSALSTAFLGQSQQCAFLKAHIDGRGKVVQARLLVAASARYKEARRRFRADTHEDVKAQLDSVTMQYLAVYAATCEYAAHRILAESFWAQTDPPPALAHLRIACDVLSRVPRVRAEYSDAVQSAQRSMQALDQDISTENRLVYFAVAQEPAPVIEPAFISKVVPADDMFNALSHGHPPTGPTSPGSSSSSGGGAGQDGSGDAGHSASTVNDAAALPSDSTGHSTSYPSHPGGMDSMTSLEDALPPPPSAPPAY